MSQLKILLDPYFKELKMPLNEKTCIRVLKWVEKFKTSWNDNSIEELDNGYQGMMLECDDGRSVYVYDDLIVYTHDNITQWITDPKKRVHKILLCAAYDKFRKELNYHLDIKRMREEKREKKKKRLMINE